MKVKKILFTLCIAMSYLFFGGFSVLAAQDTTSVPGSSQAGGVIQCGRHGQNMCTLCDLIAGMNYIIQYLMKIAIGIALAAFTIGGVMYVISAGDSGMTGSAKTTMKNAAIGFVVIFSAWLFVNTTLQVVGAKKDLGINVVSWGQFVCTPQK